MLIIFFVQKAEIQEVLRVFHLKDA